VKVGALNVQPTYQTHFIPSASSFALMLLANKNYKSIQITTTHSHSEEQGKNPSSQMQEIMYLDLDLQREATIATKEEISPPVVEEKHAITLQR
jgi:hypothetical protein